MTNESTETRRPTAAELLATGHVQLLGELLAAEAAGFQAESMMPTPRGETADFLADLEQARVVLIGEVDQLMIHRLSTSQRPNVLLEPADADRVAGVLFEDTKMDEDAIRDLETTRKVIKAIIAERINFLTAIHDDLYVALAKFVLAVSSEIASNGGTYGQIVEDVRTRNAVYRGCMTRKSWQGLTIAATSLLEDASPFIIAEGGAPGGMAAEVAVIIEAVLLATDDAAAATVRATAERLRRYYGRRQREIWPTNSGG